MHVVRQRERAFPGMVGITGHPQPLGAIGKNNGGLQSDVVMRLAVVVEYRLQGGRDF